MRMSPTTPRTATGSPVYGDELPEPCTWLIGITSSLTIVTVPDAFTTAAPTTFDTVTVKVSCWVCFLPALEAKKLVAR